MTLPPLLALAAGRRVRPRKAENSEARPRDRNAEARIQAAIVAWVRTVAPEVVIFHPPNGGLRNKSEAARLKWIGTLAGVPDLVVLGRDGQPVGTALLGTVMGHTRLHGGSIQVTSSIDVGTTMTVRIPFGRMHLPEDRVSEASGRREPGHADRHRGPHGRAPATGQLPRELAGARLSSPRSR